MGTDHKLEMDLGMDEKRFDPMNTPYEVFEEDFPWNDAIEEQCAFLLRYAILAPSSYNTQPWKFEIKSNLILVHADYERRLPVVDPHDRELIIGVGAAIFNLRVAADHFGFDTLVRYTPHSPKGEALAVVEILPRDKGARNGLASLFPVITERHTNRSPFLAARVARSVVNSIEQLPRTNRSDIFVSTEAGLNEQVAQLVAMAEGEQHKDQEFRKELAEWIRLNETRRPDGIPGAAFGMGNIASAAAPWLLKSFDTPRIFAARNFHLCIEAPALVVLHGEDSIDHWLDTGQLLEHILLYVVSSGLQASFFNMPVEVPEYRIALRHMCGLLNWPQILLRLGYCLTEPTRTPRRPVEDVLIANR